MSTSNNHRQAAKQFVKEWSGKGYEKGETQRFWLDLLHTIFGIDNPMTMMEFEIPVKTILKEKGSDFIDGYITATKVLIEQKGSHVDLSAKVRQSDGTELTPYQQARRYAAGLPVSMTPRWIVACNFTSFEVHDMEHPNDAPEVIQLADLEKEFHRLSFLVDDTNVHLKKELDVSIQAGEIVGVLYDKILAQYKDPTSPESQKALNKLCVRLVFCLYAEDAGIFGSKDMFHDYMSQFEAGEFREKLIKLFRILDQKPEERDPYEDEKLLAFPYVNGGMFAGDIEIPRINDEIRTLLLQRASDGFDWSLISPTIFGAVFESTLNPETRRAGGMHYTSIENIHKVIDPLFLNELKAELADIKAVTVARTKKEKALAFQNKIAKLKFLDPACGSGNFLTESYTSLRRLENELIRIVYGGDRIIGEMVNPIKVSINQFYGIEINDFACSVAQTALWIAESQMMAETDEIVGFTLDPLPLKTYHNIKEGNALRTDWSLWEQEEDTTVILANEAHVYPVEQIPEPALMEPVVKYGTVDLYSPDIQLHSTARKKHMQVVKFDYIMGNPPFVGLALRSASQQEDMEFVFKNSKRTGRLDYVAAWYKKASELLIGSHCRAAFVSTNSITQGEQVPILWKDLFDSEITIDFAYSSFPWVNEAKSYAAVDCVIIGFSQGTSAQTPKYIYSGNKKMRASHINGYLADAPNVYIELRGDCPKGRPYIIQGSKPWDGGFLILNETDRNALVSQHPEAEKLIRRFIGAKELIYGNPRYCLWLKGISPGIYRSIPEVRRRLEGVAEVRRNTKTIAVQAQADTPMLFSQDRQPDADYLAIPETSSENRQYIPIGFIDKDVIASNALLTIKDASLFVFGLLESNVHSFWVKTVAGRLEMRYRYSPSVYNNFPWPSNLTEAQKAKIEKTAQGILDARALFPDSSLADLYDNLTMPPELRRAHRANDAAVLEAYGFPKDASEPDIVARLFKMYQELTK